MRNWARFCSALLLGLPLVGIPQGGLADSGTLSVDQFLEQVTTNNGAIRGALESSQGASQRTEEGSLIFSTNLIANAHVMDDKRPVISAAQGDETKYKALEVGIAQNTRFGLAGKLILNASSTELMNTNPMYIRQPKFNDFGPKFELSFPLWQNLLGRQHRELEKAQNAGAGASSFGKQYEAQALLLDAEAKYWKLAAIRENLRILSHNVGRTQEILAFNTNKYKKGLSDWNDVLQAQAVLKARQLDLRMAQNEEREAMREFNSVRKADSARVDERVTLPEVSVVLTRLKQSPQREGKRNDVRAAELGYLAARSKAEADKDKTRPDVSLFASASLTGRSTEFVDALSSGFEARNPYYIAGVKLSVPLDFGGRSQVRDGYSKEALGAEHAYEQKFFAQEMDWKNLSEKLGDYYERLQLAEQVRTAQFEKLENERKRQKQGKSSTFQVFAFEQEYLGSQVGVVKVQAEALVALAQVKLYQHGGAQ